LLPLCEHEASVVKEWSRDFCEETHKLSFKVKIRLSVRIQKAYTKLWHLLSNVERAERASEAKEVVQVRLSLES
jgi:hypothetical protein